MCMYGCICVYMWMYLRMCGLPSCEVRAGAGWQAGLLAGLERSVGPRWVVAATTSLRSQPALRWSRLFAVDWIILLSDCNVVLPPGLACTCIFTRGNFGVLRMLEVKIKKCLCCIPVINAPLLVGSPSRISARRKVRPVYGRILDLAPPRQPRLAAGAQVNSVCVRGGVSLLKGGRKIGVIDWY